jgi:hypothetical protein
MEGTSKTNIGLGDELVVAYPDRAATWIGPKPATILAGGMQHQVLAACGCTFEPVSS